MDRRFVFKVLAKTPVRRGLCFVAGWLAVSTSVSLAAAEDWSAQLKKAQELLARQDYSRAYAEYRRHAEKKNNPLAQFTLALFYDLGWGRPKDAAEACRWYERAAKARLPAAEHFLGNCLVKGVNGPTDPARAAVLYEDAAQGGHWISHCALAELYLRGTGVPKDPAKGVALCEQVAARGIVKAMYATALLYLESDPAVQDSAKERAWLEQAAQRGYGEAQYRLGMIELAGGQQPKSPEKARYWFESAASHGYGPAYFPTAELYFTAPRDPATGNLAPEFLAKTYMWLSATLRRAPGPEEVRRASEMLEQVNAVMPETWKPELDERLARHFAAFPPP